MLSAGPRFWRSAVRNLCDSLRQGGRGSRLRKRRHAASSFAWNLAAEMMEPRAMLSAPAYGQGFTSIFQNSGANVGAAQDLGNTVATDASGNVYASGIYSGSGTIDPAETVTVNNPTQNETAGFLAKYNSALQLQWAVAPTITPAAGSTAIELEFGRAAVGAISGDVYVSGVLGGGSINLQTVSGTTLTISHLSSSGTTQFVARLDHATGDVVWLATGVGAAHLAIDAAENVYLMSSVGPGYVDTYNYVYGPGTGGVPVTLTSSVNTPYIVKLDSNGNAIWADDQDSGVTGTNLAVDGSGNIYFAGQFSGTADVDPSSGVDSLKATGAEDDLVEKINTKGKLVWAMQSGVKGDSFSTESIAVDGNGNVDVGATDFSSGSGKKAQTGDFAQFGNSGSLNWLVNASSNFSPMALDPAGNIYLLVGSPRNYSIAKYSAAGALDWSIGTQNGPNALAVDTAGNIWWSSPFTAGNGETNVSPASPPVYLAIDADPNTFGTWGIVEWTQPGGFAAAATQQSAGPLVTSSPAAGTTTPAAAIPVGQSEVYVGDVAQAPKPLTTVGVEDEPSVLELMSA